MKKFVYVTALLPVLALAVISCSPRKPPEQVPPTIEPSTAAKPTPKAASFSVPDLLNAGQTISLTSYSNQVILLDFWATWCPPCRYELPFLNRMYNELKDRGFILIGMTVDQGQPTDIAETVKNFGLTYPAGLAGEDVQAQYGGIRAVPTKFLLDRQGHVRQRYMGVVQEEQLRADVSALLAE